MNIGKRDKSVKRYYTFEDIPKIHILTEFFKYGFYVAVVIGVCEFAFVTFYSGSEVIKTIVAVVPLGLHYFFIVGKAIVDSKFGK